MDWLTAVMLSPLRQAERKTKDYVFTRFRDGTATMTNVYGFEIVAPPEKVEGYFDWEAVGDGGNSNNRR